MAIMSNVTWKGLYMALPNLVANIDQYPDLRWEVDMLRKMWQKREDDVEDISRVSRKPVPRCVLDMLGYSYEEVLHVLVWEDEEALDAVESGFLCV